MVLAAVMTADLFNGMNTHVWTWWVFFAVSLGIVLVWLWSVRHEVFLYTTFASSV
jgi:phospholipid-translocating ATPase